MAVTIPTGSSSWRESRPRDKIAGNEKRRSKERRRRQHETVIRTHEQTNEMGHDDADKRERPGERHRRAGRQRRAGKSDLFGAWHVHAAGRGRLGADAEEIEHARQGGKAGAREGQRHERRPDRARTMPTSSEPISHRTV